MTRYWSVTVVLVVSTSCSFDIDLVLTDVAGMTTQAGIKVGQQADGGRLHSLCIITVTLSGNVTRILTKGVHRYMDGITWHRWLCCPALAILHGSPSLEVRASLST